MRPKEYEVIDYNRNGEIIEDISQVELPEPLQERLWEIILRGGNKGDGFRRVSQNKVSGSC